VEVGSKKMSWKAHQVKESILDFKQIVVDQRTDDSVAYAVCYVKSEAERQDLLLQVGSDDQAKVYVNGREVYEFRPSRPLYGLDTAGPVALEQGTNVLVFKVVNETLNWEGCVRLVDAVGRPAQGIRSRLTPEP
jgi:hypothetical protein